MPDELYLSVLRPKAYKDFAECSRAKDGIEDQGLSLKICQFLYELQEVLSRPQRQAEEVGEDRGSQTQ